jgi:hypothetical protein
MEPASLRLVLPLSSLDLEPVAASAVELIFWEELGEKVKRFLHHPGWKVVEGNERL